ncbi:MAG TPA: competence protein CoiA family protein, partial [Herpetosiphonaceae bacterium]
MKIKAQVAMLTANAPGQRIVSVVNTVERELRALSAARQLSCRRCEARVIYRHGPIRQAHFAHFEASECVGLGDNDGDNPEHRAMKLALYQWLQESYPSAAIELEAMLEIGQRTDLLLTTPKGQRIAIECGWGALTVESWRSRHRRYQEANIADIWILHQRWFSSLTSDPLLHTDPTLRDLGAVVELIRMDEVQKDINRWMPYVVFLNPLEQAPMVHLVVETKPATTNQFYATTLSVPLSQCQIMHNQLRHVKLDAYLGIDTQEAPQADHSHLPLPVHESLQDTSSNLEQW